jgi:hypothetical protein
MDKRLFAYLKEQKIFSYGGTGAGKFAEALSRIEQKTNHNDRSRKVRKKKRK